MNNYIIVLGSNLSSDFGNSDETLKKCVNDIKIFRAIQSLWRVNGTFLRAF